MVRTLRESKAKLSELVDRASRGEDVLITVRGKAKARLTRVEPQGTRFDGRAWAKELEDAQRSLTSRRKLRLRIEDILAEIRADRF